MNALTFHRELTHGQQTILAEIIQLKRARGILISSISVQVVTN